jgi:hypothetical protein
MGPCPKQDECGGNNPRKLLNIITEIPFDLIIIILSIIF